MQNTKVLEFLTKIEPGKKGRDLYQESPQVLVARGLRGCYSWDKDKDELCYIGINGIINPPYKLNDPTKNFLTYINPTDGRIEAEQITALLAASEGSDPEILDTGTAEYALHQLDTKLDQFTNPDPNEFANAIKASPWPSLIGISDKLNMAAEGLESVTHLKALAKYKLDLLRIHRRQIRTVVPKDIVEAENLIRMSSYNKAELMNSWSRNSPADLPLTEKDAEYIIEAATKKLSELRRLRNPFISAIDSQHVATAVFEDLTTKIEAQLEIAEAEFTNAEAVLSQAEGLNLDATRDIHNAEEELVKAKRKLFSWSTTQKEALAHAIQVSKQIEMASKLIIQTISKVEHHKRAAELLVQQAKDLASKPYDAATTIVLQQKVEQLLVAATDAAGLAEAANKTAQHYREYIKSPLNKRHWIRASNALIELKGLSGFTTTIIRVGHGAEQLEKKDETVLQGYTVHRGTMLNPGDMMCATHEGAYGTIRIEQNYQGMVTDRSDLKPYTGHDADLKKEAEDAPLKAAIKFAKMLLLNHQPGDPIIIQGGENHKEQAKLIYAALRFFIKDLDIEDYDPNCNLNLIKMEIPGCTPGFFHSWKNFGKELLEDPKNRNVMAVAMREKKDLLAIWKKQYDVPEVVPTQENEEIQGEKLPPRSSP